MSIIAKRKDSRGQDWPGGDDGAVDSASFDAPMFKREKPDPVTGLMESERKEHWRGLSRKRDAMADAWLEAKGEKVGKFGSQRGILRNYKLGE